MCDQESPVAFRLSKNCRCSTDPCWKSRGIRTLPVGEEGIVGLRKNFNEDLAIVSFFTERDKDRGLLIRAAAVSL